MQSSFARSAIVLGLLSLVGPVAIDMYLPALPEVASDLSASITAAQWTITAYFIAFGLAQMIYGPLADAYGRKRPILAGLALFGLGSVLCAIAPDMTTLVIARFVQALGGAAVMVIPRAIIRDMHTGVAATRLMALVMLVISVSPMLAPLAGSAVLAFAGWRTIFAIIAVLTAAAMALTLALQPETLPVGKRVPIAPRSIIAAIGVLLRDPTFMGLTLIGGLGMASFFVFLASAAFVYTGHYGLTPTGFSLAFAANALGFFVASQFAASAGERFGMERVVLLATLGFAVCSLTLLALVAAGFDHFWLLVVMLMLGNACLGLVIPTSMVMALDPHGEIAGTASSFGGTLQMVAGGVLVMLAGPFFDGSPLPMVAIIALCGLGASLPALTVLGQYLPGRRSA